MDSLRVILADDHPFVLLGVKSALSRHRDILIVGEAASPSAAIRLLQTIPCDVLVTDLNMPEAGNVARDGVHLVRRVRTGWPAVHVVVLTSSTNAIALRSLIANDMVSVLNKTDSLDELIVSVRRARTGEVLISRSILEAIVEGDAGLLACTKVLGIR
jgi:two-component system, NarL family, captular synthesis response regulator RcsB